MYDIAIIGCGPVGAMAASFCGQAGLKTVVLEKEAVPYPLPRAVHLDHEMMRLFQAAGTIDQVLPDMIDTDGHLHVGADNGVIRYMGTIGRARPFGWSNDYFFYQPELEDHLRRSLDRHDTVEMRYGAEFIGLHDDGAGVDVTLRENGQTTTLRARRVIGCDGSHSPVRKALGVRLDDLVFDEPWLVVDAEVDGDVKFPELTGVPPQADLQKLSIMFCDPRRPLTVVPGRGNHRRWEFMLLPGEDDADMMSEARVTELIAPWLTGVPHRIVRAATYRFHGLVAEQWKVGNVFLAGDAAHQTPPFFGQGMCHGLRDVANLAWKLKLVHTGAAPDALLDTYQPERDPHVRAVISAAVEAGRYICLLDPVAAVARDRDIRARQKAAGAHATAADLIPAISTGIIDELSVAAGERFIQPRVQQGDRSVLLDDATGHGWRLFCRDATALASVDTARIHKALGLRAIDVSSLDCAMLEDWMDQRQVRHVLLRPDFYVFGTSAADAKDLLAALELKLGADHRQQECIQ